MLDHTPKLKRSELWLFNNYLINIKTIGSTILLFRLAVDCRYGPHNCYPTFNPTHKFFWIERAFFARLSSCSSRTEAITTKKCELIFLIAKFFVMRADCRMSWDLPRVLPLSYAPTLWQQIIAATFACGGMLLFLPSLARIPGQGTKL